MSQNPTHNYVRDLLKKNISVERISAKLKESGWNDDDISKIFHDLTKGKTEVQYVATAGAVKVDPHYKIKMFAGVPMLVFVSMYVFTLMTELTPLLDEIMALPDIANMYLLTSGIAFLVAFLMTRIARVKGFFGLVWDTLWRAAIALKLIALTSLVNFYLFFLV